MKIKSLILVVLLLTFNTIAFSQKKKERSTIYLSAAKFGYTDTGQLKFMPKDYYKEYKNLKRRGKRKIKKKIKRINRGNKKSDE